MAAGCRRRRPWLHAGLETFALGPKEGLALLNGTQVSTALALAGLFAAEDVFAAGLAGRGALARGHTRGRSSRSMRASTPRGARSARSRWRGAVRAHAGRQRDRRFPQGLRPRAGPVLDPLPAAGDGRLPGQPDPRRAHPAHRGQRGVRQPAGLPRTGRRGLGRQLPRRAGGLRRRHPRAGHRRDWRDLRTPARAAARYRAVRTCRRSWCAMAACTPAS